MNTTPKFSILHTSARPAKWREIYDAWLAAADHPEDVEYVLVVDERWGFSADPEAREYANVRPTDTVALNKGRKCYVDGVNRAAELSHGEILVVIADDQYPAPHWDSFLAAVKQGNIPGDDFVIWCNTGTPTEFERNIVVMPVMSRARYNRLGYVFYPQYESMYADNDLCAHASQDGVLYKANPEAVFPHRHPFFSDAPMDAAYEAQNRSEAYSLGAVIFQRRQAARFEKIDPVPLDAQPRKHLVALLPGRHWPLEFMSTWTDLVMRVCTILNFTPIFGASSEIGGLREMLAHRALNEVELPADFVLWIDSDNVLPFPYLLEMLRTLDTRPEIDAVAAWCWLLHPPGRLSCGHIDERGHVVPLDYNEMMAAQDDLQEVGYSGFPAIVMRRDVLAKAGKNPFCPILSDEFDTGKSGEDYAFCVHARERGGARIFVDRRLKIEHLKLGAIDGTQAAIAQKQVPVPVETT